MSPSPPSPTLARAAVSVRLGLTWLYGHPPSGRGSDGRGRRTDPPARQHCRQRGPGDGAHRLGGAGVGSTGRPRRRCPRRRSDERGAGRDGPAARLPVPARGHHRLCASAFPFATSRSDWPSGAWRSTSSRSIAGCSASRRCPPPPPDPPRRRLSLVRRGDLRRRWPLVPTPTGPWARSGGGALLRWWQAGDWRRWAMHRWPSCIGPSTSSDSLWMCTSPPGERLQAMTTTLTEPRARWSPTGSGLPRRPRRAAARRLPRRRAVRQQQGRG
jgi:hypothetical protein